MRMSVRELWGYTLRYSAESARERVRGGRKRRDT
jgi:hypothetical protein